ncbi:unnamed protein product [Calypogeia fissa]
MQQQQPFLNFAQISTPLAPKLFPLPTHNPLVHCRSCSGYFKRSLTASWFGSEEVASCFLRRGASHNGGFGQRLRVVCRSRSMEDSQLGDGPLEPPRPGFSRAPHSSLFYIPADDPAAAPLPPKKIKISPRRGGRQRRWKKATPAQAFAGAVVGGLWAALALKGTTLVYEHLTSHPLAHDLPMGMTTNVNQLLLTAVTGFGGFAALMFGVCSFGLALLTLKLVSAPKPPPQ